MNKIKKLLMSLILSLIFMSGYGHTAKTELVISAASSMSDVLREIIQIYESLNPEVKITTNFAGSGILLRQIERGAPVDLFVPADQRTMQEAVDKQLVYRHSIRNLASNQLVLIGRDDFVWEIGNLGELSKPNVKRIALGNPDSVPGGRYARELLLQKNLWGSISPKIIFTQNVRQCLDYVARGEVDVAFVYATDIRVPRDNVKLILPVSLKEPITYPMGLVTDSLNPDESFKFLAFLENQVVSDTLEKYGFLNHTGPSW
ncbi:MAG: molybdate ABC transporter substrate-binding protein [Betaproteobacteria bacterium]|jgi:molybdate transport system substrate-binding protein|nr:molybdate ABC transporter substrate-binding protein [Betaproteobacteria bacterium]MDA9295428.1 molybdate ABC transporter substrate-binding protein [Burkholderiales bacterium]MBT6183389.1 molybdate ABC transporter substrate-binding protein [Betaproteobacteria bacterium]MBT6531135.1 molybdate ABC transporter substrate-binding protein [Betaproteobacteria bacterium]MBT7998131.1 molybdate ABC transporter substrate-binding protein [Betaproteobacteria bacterium]